MNRLRLGALMAVVISAASVSFADTSPGELEPATGSWRAYRGSGFSTFVCSAKSESAAKACAAQDAEARKTTTRYQIRYPNRYLTVTYTAGAPACTTPQPADERRSHPCPTGTTGAWPQTASYSKGEYPNCWILGPYLPTTAPADACMPVTPPDPPPGSGFVADAGFAVAVAGEVLTVTSSSMNFGAHPNWNTRALKWRGAQYLNPLMLDFEDGVLTKNGVSYTGNTTIPLSKQWAIDTAKKPAGRTRSARHFFGGDERGALEYRLPAITGTFYAAVKYRLGANRQSGKFFRVYGQNSKNIYFSTGCDNRTIRGAQEGMTGSTWWGGGPAFDTDTWHTVEFIVTEKDLRVRVYIDGVEALNQAWIRTPFLSTSNSIDIGHMIDEPGAGRCGGHPSYNSDEGWADVFYDLTDARFMLCPGATWATRGKCEVQLPVSWASNRAEVGLNVGELGSVSGRYLYFATAAGGTRIGRGQ
jgi:hypothetical protein